VIAGPGFAKESLLAHINAESVKRQQDAASKALLLNKSKIVLATASTAYKHSIKEVLSSPDVLPRIQDTKAVQESRAMESFLTMLGSEPARAFYGPGHVNAAHELGAITPLLISDGLFRTADPRIRRKYEKLVEDVRGGGGTAFVLSSAHGSGAQLEQLSGLAAILRFPLPELEDMEFEGGY
jgi:protein pelota